ncbi:MAG TPA: hypothetical protein VMS17_18835 [Gemmataceae bacterium]|nr:hypothetical protein [Gemmataceae bacterium]
MILAIWGLPEGYGTPEQWLAILGGAAVGALLFGFLAQLLYRGLSQRKLPALPRLLARLAGAVLLGLLTAWFVWHGTGFGPGNGNGNGNGNATSNGDGARPQEANKPPDKPTPTPPVNPQPPPVNPQPPPDSVLRLHIMTSEALKQLPGGDQADSNKRWYKVVGDDDVKDLMTVEKMKDYVQKRYDDKKPPLLGVDIVTRKGVDPAPTSPRATQLETAIAEVDPMLPVHFPDH